MRRGFILVIFLLLQLFGTAARAWEQQPTANGIWHLEASSYGSKLTPECPVNLAVFVPNQPTTTVIVYFHGYRDTIARVMKSTDYRLGDNNQAIVIVPQGPCDTKELRWEHRVLKNLPHLFTEALRKAQLEEPERVILVAHSGGYWPAEQVLKYTPSMFNEAWLLDALYGKDFSKFVTWTKGGSNRLLRAACTHRQTDECAELGRLGAEVEPARTTHNRTVGVFVPRWLMKGGKLTASRAQSE